MNTLQLIQQACRRWLTVPDQSALDAAAMQDLLDGLNVTQGEVWRAMPHSYRTRPLSWDFYGPEQGYVTTGGYGTKTLADINFPGITNVARYKGPAAELRGTALEWNGEVVTESPRPFCSMLLDGDPSLNQFTGSALIHPYLGASGSGASTTPIDFSSADIDFSDATIDFSTTNASGGTSGTVAATIYHDAKLLPYQIERIIGPVVDRIQNRKSWHVESHQWAPGSFGNPLYSIQKVMHAGVLRTMVQLTPQHSEVVVLSCTGMVSPLPLTLGSSLRAVDLPYDEEIGAMIAAAAGINLWTHRSFRTDLSGQDLADAHARTFKQIAGFSPRTNSDLVMIGTPHGW